MEELRRKVKLLEFWKRIGFPKDFQIKLQEKINKLEKKYGKYELTLEDMIEVEGGVNCVYGRFKV